jgi:hypothetical protein
LSARPPIPSGPFAPEEIAAFRDVVDCVDYSRIIPLWSSHGHEAPLPKRPPLMKGHQDNYERNYIPLYVFAKHGLTKKEAVLVRWADFSWNQSRLGLPGGGYVVLDEQSRLDLWRLWAMYANKIKTFFIVGPFTQASAVNPRVMERWAWRASLRRVPVRYEDLVAGFRLIDPNRQRRYYA